MSGLQSMTKLQNEHADGMIEVQGSSITSNSQEDQELPESREHASQHYLGNREFSLENKVQGAYDSSDYSDLPINRELKELFQTIQRYRPAEIKIEPQLKGFVPEYLPTIGEVGAFIKMPRPDNKPETLGLERLDQPFLNMKDQIETIVIRRRPKVSHNRVYSLENAEKNPKKIKQWIDSCQGQKLVPPMVSYEKSMPYIDDLMQIWPEEVQQILNEIAAPSEDIDLSLTDYSRIACNILDIPFKAGHKRSLIESLHVMFTLFSAFKQNQHFFNNLEEVC